jgi:RNA polymerase sigma-70 factor (ECF subfamily)
MTAFVKSPRGRSPGRPDAPPGGLSPAVLRVLVDNHDRFLGFLRRRVRPREVAEEILQEAILRGISHGGSLRDEKAAMAWFYRLLRNTVVDHVRSESAKKRGLLALERELTSYLDSQTDDESLVDTICGCVTNLIDALRPEYATAIKRVDLKGEPLRRFAVTAGITRGNATVRLFRARRALRREIERNCGSCGEHGGYQCQCRDERHSAAPVGGGATALRAGRL